MTKSDFLYIIYTIKITNKMNKYDTILEQIEKIAVTISLTSDPDDIQRLRRIMRMKIEAALNEKTK
jgi:hypothetical protein